VSNRTHEQRAEATPESTLRAEQQFQHANNLVMTAMRLELEIFHIYTSTLMDRIARITKCTPAPTVG